VDHLVEKLKLKSEHMKAAKEHIKGSRKKRTVNGDQKQDNSPRQARAEAKSEQPNAGIVTVHDNKVHPITYMEGSALDQEVKALAHTAQPTLVMQQLTTPQVPLVMTNNAEVQPVLLHLSQSLPGSQQTQQELAQQQPQEAKLQSEAITVKSESPRKKGELLSFLPSMKSPRKPANPSKVVPVDVDVKDQNDSQKPSPLDLIPEDPATTQIQALYSEHGAGEAVIILSVQHNAAIQIQAVARGHLQRKATKSLLEQQTTVFSKPRLPSFCEEPDSFDTVDAPAQPKEGELPPNNMDNISFRETAQHDPESPSQNDQREPSASQSLQEDNDESNDEGIVYKYVIKPIKFVFIIIGIVLAGYIADFSSMLANVFLIVKGVNHLVHWNYDLHLNLLVLEFGRFLRVIHPGLEVLAQIYHALMNFFKNLDIEFIPLETMQVTCDGAKAPGKLFGNILILLFVTVLFEARIFAFLVLTLKASLNLLKYSLKMKGYSVVIILLVTNSFLFFEFIFRYIVQLLATGTVVRDFYPSHPHNVNCGSIDELLSIVSSMVAWGVIIPAFHNMMRTFVAGIPSKCNFPHVENKIPLLLRKIFLHPSIWRNKAEAKNNKSTLNLRLLRRHEVDATGCYNYYEVPSFFEIVLLICLDFSRCRFKVLRTYIKCMRWKVDQLFKMTFGLWDREILRGFNVDEMVDTYSVIKDDTKKEHQEAIASIGMNHAMIWQFVPAFVVAAKFGEYSNKCPLYVHKSGKVKPLLCQDEHKPWSGDSMKSKIVTTFKWIFSCVKGRLVKWIIYMMMFIFTCAFALVPSVFWLWGYALIITPLRLERITVTIRDFFF